MSMIELRLADGEALDIMSENVLTFEGVVKGANENFPQACGFLRYVQGNEVRTALVIENFGKLRNLLGERVADWLTLTKEDGGLLGTMSQNITSRMSIKDETRPKVKTEIGMAFGNIAATYFVTETRDEIKNLSGTPSGLVELNTTAEKPQ